MVAVRDDSATLPSRNCCASRSASPVSTIFSSDASLIAASRSDTEATELFSSRRKSVIFSALQGLQYSLNNVTQAGALWDHDDVHVTGALMAMQLRCEPPDHVGFAYPRGSRDQQNQVTHQPGVSEVNASQQLLLVRLRFVLGIRGAAHQARGFVHSEQNRLLGGFRFSPNAGINFRQRGPKRK